jgi:hypothetical protein
MASVSGFGGAVKLGSDIVSTVSNWNISQNITNNEHYASNTGRYSKILSGVKSMTGSYQRYATVPFETLGGKYAFIGDAGASKNKLVTGTPPNEVITPLHILYQFPAIATGVDIQYNWESRDANSYTVNFTSSYSGMKYDASTTPLGPYPNPDLYQPNPVAFTEVDKKLLIPPFLCYDGEQIKDIASPTNPITMMQPSNSGIRWMKVNDDGSPTGTPTTAGDWTALCVKNCSLSFQIQPVIDNNSCSGSWQEALEGGNVSASFSATVSTNDFQTIPNIGDDIILRVYPAACDGMSNRCWTFYAMNITGLSNFNVDIEGGSAIGFTMQGQFNMQPSQCSFVTGAGICDPMGRVWTDKFKIAYGDGTNNGTNMLNSLMLNRNSYSPVLSDDDWRAKIVADGLMLSGVSLVLPPKP